MTTTSQALTRTLLTGVVSVALIGGLVSPAANCLTTIPRR